ncbi:MAG: porin family protein [Proteiniphilum sp.]|jgi:hypothetical protein|uniref:porin family protein n=1 Tax=Proteiniphilum sp. TaxID=1926877 RepID=UPI002B212B22|nr:porin family protein [Proteiniphilum sp.]MEA5062143.1 porin family protein [Petrimonas sp.]MEA5128940.1 porin family protein [Proteiniphilum sp.]
MRKMTFSLIVAMLVAVTSVSAQQLYLGVKGGINLSNFSGDLDDADAKVGFNVGLAADYEFMFNHAIQTGLFFTTKGAKYEGDLGDVSGKLTMNPMYLQLPVHYAYKLDVAPGTRLVFHAGPYMAVGVGGKVKVKASGSSAEVSDDFFQDGAFKRFDAGLGLGVGAEFGPLLLDLGWDMGLTNISDISGADAKNQNAYLTVGYRF